MAREPFCSIRLCERSKTLKRRIFIRNGVLLGVGISLPSTEPLSPTGNSMEKQSIPDLLQSGMVWTSESAPVPVRRDGRASAIAGSASGTKAPGAVDQHAIFTKELSLSHVPALAELHLFAYTRYRLYVNGQYVGRGPSRFQNQRPEYDSRNIAQFLQTGRNVIAVLVHCDAPTGRIMHHDPGFAAVFEWSDPGGVRRRIVTDTSWRAEPDLSFVSRDEAWSSIEEHIDARRSEEWTKRGYDTSHWPFSVSVGGVGFFPLWPRTTPLQSEKLRPWRSTTESLPLSLSAPAEVDFELEHIIQGYHVLEFYAEEGSELEVSYLLPQNQKSGTNTYVARAGAQTYIGGDTFAFNRLSLLLKKGKVRLMKAQTFEVRYPFERIGEFESSDPYLNKLWTICARSLEVLSEDAYVDCADRERVEWTDSSPPAFDCTRVMMAGPLTDGGMQWSDGRLLKALLRRIALTQQPDGQLKAHSCSERWDIHAIMEDRSCDWVILLREYFDSTGDKALVQELWTAMSRLLNWFLSRRTGRGLVLAREWEVWDNPVRYQVCEGAGLNALVYRALRDASYLGQSLGKSAEISSLSAAADQLAAAFNAHLWDAQEGSYYGALFGPGSKMNPQLDKPMFNGPIVDGHYRPTLQAALFALDGGIVPSDRLQAVQRWILSHQDEALGPMSHNFLFKTLYAMDEEHKDVRVLDLMRSGWKNQVESPWQTVWEDLPDRGGSKVHIYGMVPGYFLSAYVLGVRRDEPVWNKSILVEPRHGSLSHARGVVVTEFGPVSISWTRSANGAMSVEFTAPASTTVIVRLPRRTGASALVVDGHMREAKSEGPYLKLSLPAGRHTVKHLD